MRSFPPLSAVAAAALLVAPATAAEIREHPRAVLELFTSQGCSSCPKADLKFQDLGKQADLITLAYHVDYWDYIGWTDTFGRKENSDLQRAYAESWKSSRIYTPQMIVNGQKAMPALGGMFSDQQVADVVNYIRTHFGNNYKDKVTPADVKATRP